MGEVAEIEMQSNNASVEDSERFPPRMILSLRVLLVEADDSTRQIIAALLRKCGYKVAAVRDGLKAWETLKNNASDIDLLLTEVDLPSISGFSLLTLVMEHDTCKNIPVIMTSSQDSISTVFKCMLKGAVDFLIKPVRRNELKNLWQHVWRRHAISRPPQSLTSPQNKLDVAAENNAASNNSSGSVASTQKNSECRQKTSEAQSTCTSPFLEAESGYMEIMQDVSQLKSSSNLSISDTVEHEISDTVEHEMSTKIESESPKHNNVAGDKSTVLVSEAARCNKTSTGLRLGQGYDHNETENQDEVIKTELCKANPHINTEIHQCNELVEPSTPGAIDLIAKFENITKSTDGNFSFNGGNTTKYDFDTQLELSLRRDFPGSSCTPATEESQILNHSNASAFSWYSSNKMLHPLFPTKDSHELCKLSENTNTYHQYGGKNQNDENMTNLVIGQCEQVEAKLPKSQLGFFPAIGDTSDNKSVGHGNDFHPMFYTQSDVHPTWTPKSVCQKESSPIPHSTSSQSNPKAEHHWSDDGTCTLDQNVNDQSITECAMPDSPAADLSSAASFLHDAENHNSNSICGGIGSGSDGNATSAVVGNNNFESSTDNNHFDVLGGTKSGVPSQREAALTKFRLKRKDRCYDKKVRYESRKRLAEQRPRVKGQFVRQVADAGCS